MIFGVLVVFAFECLRLYFSILIGDTFDIVISSIVIAHYLVAFVKCEHLMTRTSLALTYFISFIVWIVYFVIFLCVNNIDDIIDDVNEIINDHMGTDGQDLANTITDAIWWFIIIYALVVVAIRSLFTHIMYHWYVELKETLKKREEGGVGYDTLNSIVYADDKKTNSLV